MQHYSPLEEKTNILSHAFGLVFSLPATVLLLLRASQYGNVRYVVGVSIFGASLIALYTASTCYHYTRSVKRRSRLRVFDHAAIYGLIAGTYTPFTLITLHGTVGWIMFGVTWTMAVAGIILKLFYTGKYNLISTLMYVLMGWIIIFAIKPLINNLSAEGLFWLLAGGAAYTTGAVLYGIKKIIFNHAIFHIFVLLGSFCHFVAVYFYVLAND